MASPTTTVLVISRDPEVRRVGALLQADGLTVRAIDTVRELQRGITVAKSAGVVVLDAELTADESFPIVEVIERIGALPVLVLMASDGVPNLSLGPKRAALDEAARKPITASVLALRVKALILAAGLNLPAPPVAPPSAATTGPLDLGDDPRGELTVVFSVKGGSGKSTIAANLATGLASLYGCNTLLVDANLWFGDLGVLLNLHSPRSSFDVCGTEDADLFALPKAVVPHASGASVLLRPFDPLSVEKIKPRAFVDAVDRYRSLYEHVIVDCAAVLDELNLDLLELATRILLVVTPEMGALHNTARFLGLAERLGHTDKLELVLNRSNSGIGSEDLQRTLGMDVKRGVVSAGRMMLEAVNEGSTLFAMDPTRRERITQDLAAIVELVAGREQPPVQNQERRGRGFPFLRRSA